MVDLYCERTGPDLWAEPVNALTNLAFFTAAWATWLLLNRAVERPPGLVVLTALLATIGVGSLMFHTSATTWARILDVAPILVFQLTFFWLYLREIVGALLIAALVGRQFSDLLNGSVTYLPAFLVLFGLGLYHWATRKHQPTVLLLASSVFAASLFFRAFDQAFCPFVPVGTHFLWHLLNALVLYLA